MAELDYSGIQAPRKKPTAGVDYSGLSGLGLTPKQPKVEAPVIPATTAPVVQAEEPGFLEGIANTLGEFTSPHTERVLAKSGKTRQNIEQLYTAQVDPHKVLLPIREPVNTLIGQESRGRTNLEALLGRDVEPIQQAKQIGLGAIQGTASVAEQFGTGENLTLLATLKALPAAARNASRAIQTVAKYGPAGVDTAFGIIAARHAKDQWEQWQALRADPNTTTQQLADATTQLALSTGLGLLGFYSGVKSARGTYRAGKEAKRLEQQAKAEEAKLAAQEQAAQAKTAAAEAERLARASEPRQFIVSEEGKAVVTPESVAKAGIAADQAQLKRLEELSIDNLAKKINPNAKGFADLSPAEKRQAAKLRKEAGPEIRTLQEAIAARQATRQAPEGVAPGRELILRPEEEPPIIDADFSPEPLLGLPSGRSPVAGELPPGAPRARALPPPRRAFYAGGKEVTTRTPPEIENDILARTLEVEQQGGSIIDDPVLKALDDELGNAYARNREQGGTRIGQVGPIVAEPPAPGFREFVGRPKPPEEPPPVVAPAPTPEPVAPPVAKTPAERFVEIRDQLAADYGKTFDQLTPGQKAAVTRNAKSQAVLEARSEALAKRQEALKAKQEGQVKAASEVSPEKRAPQVYKGGKKPKPQETPSEKGLRESQETVRPAQRPPYAPTEKTATAKSFGAALDDFNALSGELRGKPIAEQMAIAKQRLEEKGYHPAIVDELTNPERLKRPELEGDVHDATTREGRLKRASEPPSELKATVDQVADKDVNYRNAKADYDHALQEIGKEVERLGGEVIVNTDDGTLSIKMMPGKPKISAADQALINRLKQEAAEAGAYSLESVGKGFQVFAAPLKIKDAAPLTGTFREKLAEFIRRKNKLKTAKKEYDVTNKRATDKLVDNYFARRVKGEPTGSFVGRAGDQKVEVGVRRKQSATDPDVPIVEPKSGKTYGERIKAERAAALKRSEAQGPKGEPFAKTSPVKQETAKKRASEGKPFFDIRSHLDESERAALEKAHQAAKQKAGGQAYSIAANPAILKDWATIAYYNTKGLSRAVGEKVPFEQWKEAIRRGAPADVFRAMEPHLRHLHAVMGEGWKPGDPIPVPMTPKDEEDNKKAQAVAQRDRIGNFFTTTDIMSRFGRQNKVAGQIAEGYRQADALLKSTEAKYTPKINKLAKAIGIKQRSKLAHISGVSIKADKAGADLTFKEYLNNPSRSREGLNPEELDLLKLYEETKADGDAQINAMLKEAKIKEMLESGGDIMWEVINELKGRKKGFQPTLNTAAREALFVDKGGPLYDAIVDDLIQRNPKLRESKAGKLTDAQLRTKVEGYIKNRQLYKFDDIPTHTHLGDQLVPISATDPLSATQALAYEQSRLIAFMKVFGTKYKQTLKDLRKEYVDQFAKEGKSAQGKGELFDELHDAYWGLRKRSAFSKRIESDQPYDASKLVNKWLVNPAIKGIFNVAVPALRSAALSASALLQMPQHTMAVPNTGWRNLARAYKDAARYAKTSAELEAIGGIDRDIMNWSVRNESASKDIGRIFSGAISHADFMHGMSSMQDVLAASMYRNWARGLSERMNAGKKLTVDQKQTLQNLKFTDAQIKLIEQGKLVEPKGAPETAGENLFVDIIRRGRKSEQFTGLSQIERSRFQNASGLSKLILPFQSYNIGMANRYRREAQVLHKALKSGDSKAIMSSLKRFGILVGITEGLGEWTSLMRHAIRGHSEEDIKEDSAYAQFAQGNVAKGIGNFASLWAESAFLSPFIRVASNKMFIKELQENPVSAVVSMAWGPQLVQDLAFTLVPAGKYTNLSKSDRIAKFLEDRTPAFKYVPDGFRRGLSVVGLADVSDLDLGSATNAYWDWADENLKKRPSGPKFGYAEDKAQTKKAYATFKKAISLANEDIKEGSKGDLRKILDKALAAKAEKVKSEGELEFEGQIESEAYSRVQKALQGYRFKISELSDEEKESLKEKIGEKRYRTLEIHDQLLNELIDTL